MARFSPKKISLLFHRTRVKSRYMLSILIGLVLGFALSLASIPLMAICDSSLSVLSGSFPSALDYYTRNGTYSLREKLDPFRLIHRSARSVVDLTLVDYGSKDYEPEIRPAQPTTNETRPANAPKIVRPRYIADELGIREKVFVAVLTETNRLNTFGLFINQTLQDHANRVVFFIDDVVQNFPKGMQVVAIHDIRAYLKPFYVLKYLAEKVINGYDWFLLVPDNTFIRGFKMNEFLNHISINQDLYMGQAFDDIHAVYCYFGSGIILSGTVLRKIHDELEWCTKNAFSQDLTDNIGRCVLKTTKLPCTNTASNYQFKAYVNYRFEFDTDVAELSKSQAFNQTLTVHPVNDLETMLKLQKYFNEVEINEMTIEIKKYEATIESLSCYSVEGCGNIPWPVGVPAPFKPPTRFDVLRWDYFNETHIYLKTDSDVVDLMKHNDYEDVHEVIDHAVQQLQKKYGPQLKMKQLQNGYRQFDPTRGTHYILDLLMTDGEDNEVIKHAELMRPLGLVEIVPMPFVNESRKLFMVVPILSSEQSIAARFLRHANKTLFEHETRDRLELLLVHIVTNKNEFIQTQEWLDRLRWEIDLIHKTRPQLMVTYHTLLLPSPSIPLYSLPIYLLDFLQPKLRPSSLIFITNPYVYIDADFLSRFRLNVIEETQCFFPIAFHQYHPDIIARTHEVNDNKTIEVHKFNGWFNPYTFDQIGLCMSDYISLKKLIAHYNRTISRSNLYDLFVQLTDMHILRAPDQSLRAHYRVIQCDAKILANEVEYNRCLMQREKGLASRSQLAMIVIDDEQKQKINKT